MSNFYRHVENGLRFIYVLLLTCTIGSGTRLVLDSFQYLMYPLIEHDPKQKELLEVFFFQTVGLFICTKFYSTFWENIKNWWKDV